MNMGDDNEFRQRSWNSSDSASSGFTADYSPPVDVQELNELRNRLRDMKKLLGEEEALDMQKLVGQKKQSFFLDGNMVSLVFAVAMGLVLSVSVYAFQHLYTAVMKRFNR